MVAPLSVVAVILAAVIGVVSANAQNLPMPPQAFVDTTYVAPTGVTHNAANTAAFAAALDAAVPGDEIVLQAGVTYQGPFTLKPKSGTGWITIRTNQIAQLPAGTRVGPQQASFMPKIVGGGSPHIALQTSGAAHHYRLIGLEFSPTPGVYATALVRLGAGDETTLSALPHHLIIDRSYIHGHPADASRRGIALNSADTAIIESYISDWKDNGGESHGIAGWNGSGPYKIENNYIEAAGINMIIGGEDPKIPNLVPSDIEVRGNHFFKPLTWQATAWNVKNLFELKNAARVIVDGNMFENNWPNAQQGTAILFSIRNQNGGAPWTTLRDIAFTNNWVTNTGSGLKVTGKDIQSDGSEFTTAGTWRVLIRNNVFEDVGATGGNGRLFEVYNNVHDLVIEHNSGFPTTAIMATDDDPSDEKATGFYFRYNITFHGDYGVKGSGLGIGTPSLDAHFQSYVFTQNVIVGGTASSYPAGNNFVSSVGAVGFVDYAGGDYHLAATSPFKGQAPGPSDMGANIDAILAAIAGGGSGGGGGGGGGDTTAPMVNITTPANGVTVTGTINVNANATDNIAVIGVRFKLDGVNLAAEDTSAPYSIAWDTATATNGQHTLTAVARDAAGNETTSAPITVTVSTPGPGGSDTTPPVVSITSPAAGSTVSGTITVTAGATDNVGVVSVQFKLDGANLGTADTAAPYSVSWNTTGATAGTHTLTAVARDAAGNQTTSSAVMVTVSNPAPAAQPVVWTSVVGPVTVNGNSLSKNSGCQGCADAGAISQQQIVSGDGYVEFTVSNTAPERYLGLSNGNPGTSGSEIKFALSVAEGYAAVMESGVYRWDVTAAAGDVFRIAVAGSEVQYSKNGSVFYLSQLTPVYPLLVDTSLFELGSDLTNVMIAGASSGGGGGVQNVVWTSVMGPVTVNGNSLSKNSGCQGCADAGAISQQQIQAGDGYVEFSVSNTTAERYLGLSNGNPGTSGSEIKFALNIGDGYASVRESGVYRADVSVAVGDLLRIAVVGSVVTYSKNGSVFYTSQVAPSYPLLVDTSLFELGSDLNNVVISGAGSGPSGGGVNVVWTSAVGPVTVNGNSLSKNSGCQGCADAGAISQQQIVSGDGYVEFTTLNIGPERYLGLSNGNPGTSGSEIKFALSVADGYAAVMESGAYRADTSIAAGDLLRVAVVGGIVKYSKNGTVFYTSAVAPTYPLLVDTSLFELGSDLTNAVIFGAQ